MKKKQLKLHEMKLKSFVTNMDNITAETVRGGEGFSYFRCTMKSTPCNECKEGS